MITPEEATCLAVEELRERVEGKLSRIIRVWSNDLSTVLDALLAAEARIRLLEEALRWAIPLAAIALEDHRLLRLKHGHTDPQFQFITTSGTRMVGLSQDEYDKLTNARRALAKPEETPT